MKNPRAVLMFIIAVVIGLGASVVAAGWVAQKSSGGSKIVVAAVDIELGNRLTPEMLKTVEWPSGSIPNGAVEDPKTLQDRVVKTNILRGEPVQESKLAPLGSKGGLSAVIEEGKRAMTVRVNDVVGVAGFALPGNYVDIVVSTQLDNETRGGDKQISKIVLEHILVLAVAQEANRDETKPKVVNAVTLEVTPDQAEKLDLARSVGSLSLMLRNQVDKVGVDTQGIMKSQLLAGDQVLALPEAPKPAKPAPRGTKKRIVTAAKAPEPKPVADETRICVEVIKGHTKTVECF